MSQEEKQQKQRFYLNWSLTLKTKSCSCCFTGLLIGFVTHLSQWFLHPTHSRWCQNCMEDRQLNSRQPSLIEDIIQFQWKIWEKLQAQQAHLRSDGVSNSHWGSTNEWCSLNEVPTPTQHFRQLKGHSFNMAVSSRQPQWAKLNNLLSCSKPQWGSLNEVASMTQHQWHNLNEAAWIIEL